MPVSITSNCSSGVCPGSRHRRVTIRTSPASVNLTALPTRLMRICRRRVGSVWMVSGMGPQNSVSEARSGRLGTHAHQRGDLGHDCGRRTGGLFQRQLAGLDLGEVQNVVDDVQQILPFRWMVSTASTHGGSWTLSRRMSAKPRMAVMGVRISWLMLARNSLFARVADSAAHLASSRRLVGRLQGGRIARGVPPPPACGR